MHQKHEIMEPDAAFEAGTLEHLVPGNEGRVLDGRRTPGRIEAFDPDSAMFIWRITGFEDAGQCWEIPAEQICSYQFRTGSDRLSREESIRIGQRCEVLNRPLEIRVMDAAREIAEWETWAGAWLAEKGEFRGVLDFAGKTGESALCRDLEKYMNESVEYDPLVRVALIHYQFETIHPFLDGNGRIGRLLILLYLMEQRVLTKPVIYISYFLKKNQVEYYDRMTEVRRSGSR